MWIMTAADFSLCASVQHGRNEKLGDSLKAFKVGNIMPAKNHRLLMTTAQFIEILHRKISQEQRHH